jgi:predicted kinase
MQAVVLCGIQGAGKSTLFVERFFSTHVRISRDLLRTPHREARLLDLCIETQQPFVVDKTNATPDDRGPYVRAARAAGLRTAAWFVDTPTPEAIARKAARDERWKVPLQAILGTHKQLVPPSRGEGFDAIWHAWADGRGGFHVQQRPAAPAAETPGEPRFQREPAPVRGTSGPA